MILLEVKRYIKQHQRVTLRDIQHHFDIDENAVIGLMEPLLQQGYIQEISADSTSTSCQSGKCRSDCYQASKKSEFQWVNKPLKPLSIPVQIL